MYPRSSPRLIVRVLSLPCRAQGSARTSSPHPVAGSCNATAELQPTEERCCADTSSLSPLAASTGAAQLRQTQEMQPDVALREHLHKEGCTDEIQAEQRQAQQGGAGQGWDNQGRADQGQAEEGQAQKDADEGEVQRARGGRRVTRASAQHVAFVQDMHASGGWLTSAGLPTSWGCLGCCSRQPPLVLKLHLCL